ncbi:MAG: YfhO family protein [Ruminococcus sp.]|nr:YfhO family protein [Ruminococcus sp.]
MLLTLIAYYNFDIYPLGEGKHRSVLTLDLNGQYIYYFEGIRDAFWGDGSFFYNWSRNLSGGFMGVIGYYLASPFTLIPILMPRKYILEAIMIMQICKVGACGATFCIYAQRSKKLAAWPSVIFSTMYAMMAYVVIQLINPMWIDGPIFLPLIILGVEYLIDDGRKVNYIIPTAIMFVANFYIGFMVAIFVAIYFVYYLFFGTQRKFKTFKEYAKTCGIMGVSTIVVLLCSMFMILPVYNALALGKFDFSEPVYDWHKHLFKLPELVPTLLPNQYYSVNVDEGTGFYGRPEIYCGVLTVVLFPLYFFNKDIKRNKKLGAGFLLIVMVMSMYIKPLNMYWHGGQDPNWLPYRYSFLVSFILVSMAAEVFVHLDGLRINPRSMLYDIMGKHAAPMTYGLSSFIGIALFVVFFESKMKSYNYNESKYKYVAKGLYYKAEMNYGADRWQEIWLGTLGFGLLLAAVYIVLIFTYSTVKNKNAKAVLLTATACLVCFEGGYNCYDSFRKIYKEVGNSCHESYAEITSAPEDIVSKLEDYDGSFYRAEKTYSRMGNDDMAYGLRGISHSSSVMNARAIKVIEYLGYFTQSFESKYEGSNPVADSLLGIKYVIDAPNRSYGSKKLLDASYVKVPELTGIAYKRYDEPNLKVITDYVDIYNNPNALSIGWMADRSILDIPYLDENNPFNNLNTMLASMTGNSGKEYYKSVKSEVLYDENQVRLHDYIHTDIKTKIQTVHDCYESYSTSTDAVVNVRFTSPVDGNIYMHLNSKVKKACNVWVGMKKEDGTYAGTSSSQYDGYGTYFETNSSPIVRLGPFTKGQEVEVRFTIQAAGDKGQYTGANEYLMVKKDDGFHFCYLDEEEFAKDINSLREGQWNIDMSKSTERHLEGTVNVKQGQVFVTSIPYEPGWEIKIDGKKIKNIVMVQKDEDGIQRLVNKDKSEGQVALLDAFIGIRMDDISDGEHTISMTYTPPGFKIGVFTLILGIIIIIMFVIYDKRYNPVLKARREEKERKKLGLTEETPEADEQKSSNDSDKDEKSDGSEKTKKKDEKPSIIKNANADMKKSKNGVQIIKSKGEVAGNVEEKARKADEKAEEEAKELQQKTDELIKNFNDNASEVAEETEEAVSEAAAEAESTAETAKETVSGTTAEPKKPAAQPSKPKNHNNGKKKKKKK